MFVELHILQNFAPSNLNRDDTGSPKDCEFGGYRRARISSQAFKRAIRRDSNFAELLEQVGAGVRTRRLILEIAEGLSSQRPVPESMLKTVAEVFKEGGLGGGKDEETTQIILFLERSGIDEMVKLFAEHWQDLTKGKREARDTIRNEIGEILAKAVRAPDIALFGRMVEIKASEPFGKPQLRVDAATQVAHAISTNKVNIEFDYFTAVDDLMPSGETGAAMIETTAFNSACFYRYANIDVAQLLKNLDGEERLALKTVEAFLRASVSAIPTGKQNSFAAHNPPSFILAVVRRGSLWNLANAFLNPVYPTAERDLVQLSVERLDRYWGQLASAYGVSSIAGMWAVNLVGDGLNSLKSGQVNSVEGMINGVMSALTFGSTNGRAA